MKILISVLFTTLGAFAAQAISLTGVLEKNVQGSFITFNYGSQKYQVSSLPGEVTDSIAKMESGDTFIGNGQIDENKKTVLITSLDYVGLKKMLGLWYSGGSVMDFTSFTDLSVYPFNTHPLILNLDKTDIRYSVAPFRGNQWAVFLSSRNSTLFGTLEFEGTEAILRVFNSETGNASSTMRLIRWKK